MRRIILSCLLAIPVAAMAQSRTRPPQSRVAENVNAEATRAATTGLSTLRALAEKSPEVMGLSAREAESAVLRPPLRVVFVRLDRLKAYRASDDPRSLLADVSTLFYPVAVGADIRSSITVKRTERGWVAAEFGNDELAKKIQSVRGGATASALLVRVPALNLDFVGNESGGTLMLTSLFDVPGTKIRAGATADARAVLAALVPMANAHNGLPT
ncbi:MAG: hypothetical protein AABO58_18815 [Acidobacteriota bacterium]